MSASAKLQVVISAQDGASSVFNKVGASLSTLGSSTSKAGAAIGSMATSVATGAAVIGGAFATGIGAAVSKAADFEAGMSKVKAASGASATEMAALGAAAIQLGSDTELAGIGATDAAMAMEELAKGGVSVSDQLGGATKGALLLASSGSIDVATATGIATKAMLLFSLSGADVAHVADLLSAGANKSATDVGQLGAAFNQSAAVAKNAGLSIEELTGTLSFMAQRGMEGSDAGTSLKTALLALQAPTDVAKDVMKEYGINVRDANGEMLPMADIAQVLKDRLSGLSAAQRDAALKTIFGNDAIRVGIALYEGGGDAIRDWTAQVNDAGNAARTGATINGNLKGSFSQLGAVLETGAIQFGSKLTPVLKTATDEIGKFIDGVMKSPQATQAMDNFASATSKALTDFFAKVKDPAFQDAAKQWATAALDVGKAVVGLAQDIGSTLGPPLRDAVNWFNGLDDAGKKQVISFGLVAASAIKFRDELGTLKTVVSDVVTAFGEKLVAKKALTAANEKLAGSAGGTATAIGKVGAAVAPVAIGIAELAVASGGYVAAGVGFVAVADQVQNKFGEQNDIMATNVQHWDATALAIAHGATEQNGFITGFQKWLDIHNAGNATQAEMILLWNSYTESMAGAMMNLDGVTRAAMGTAGVMPTLNSQLGEGAIAGAGFNNALVGIGLGAAAIVAPVTASTTVIAAQNLSMSDGAMRATSLGGALTVASGAFSTYATVVAASYAPAATFNAQLAAFETTIRNYSQAAAIAEGDTGEFGTALGIASSNITGYGQALTQVNVRMQNTSAEAQGLQGYLGILQNRWNELDVATKNGKNTTAEQRAEYEKLAPAIQYLNGRMGVLNETQIDSALKATANYQGLLNASDGYGKAAAASGAAAASFTNSANATRVAEIAAIGASNKYNELGQVMVGIPPVVPTSVTDNAAVAKGNFFDLKGAIDNVPKATTVATDATSAVTAAGHVAGLNIAIAMVPKSFTVTATVDTSAAIAAIADLAARMPHSPAEKGPFKRLPNWDAIADFSGFSDRVQSAVALVEGLGGAIDQSIAESGKRAGDAVSSVAKAFQDTMSAVSAIASFDFAKNSPTGDQLGWLSHLVSSMVATIQDAAKGFNEKGLKSTSEFADAMGKVGGGIKNALDGLLALGKANFAENSPTGSAMGWFAHLVASLVATIQEAARDFDTAGLKAVSEFSDAASKVTGLVKSGVDALSALSKYADPPRAAIYAFGKTIRALINDVALIAEQVTQQATDSAAKFAEGAGKVVGILGNGVEGFRNLADYTAIPTAAIYAFGKSLRAVINDFALLSEQITPAATSAAALFAEGAGKVVGILGSGVSGFAALANYAPPAAAAIYDFGKTIRAVINDFALLAEQITQEATDKAAVFAGGVGSVVGIIGGAVEGLGKLATFVAPSQQAIDNFSYAVYAIVQKMADLAGNISGPALAQANAFATAAGAVFNAAKGGLDVFKGFKDLVIPSSQAIDQLAVAIQYVVNKMAQIANDIGREGIAKAQVFSTATSAVFSTLKTAMDTLTNLAGFKDVSTKTFDLLLQGMQDAIDRAQGMVQFAKNLKTEAEEYLKNMEDAARLFAKGAAMGGLGGPAAAAGSALGESVAAGARDALDSHSPSRVMASIGADVVSGLVAGMDAAQQDAASKAASVASAVAGAIQSTLAALGAVAGFSAGRAPSGGQIAAVLDYTKGLVRGMAEAAGLLSEEGLKATDAYAKGAASVVDTFGKAADLLGKLGSYVAPSATALYDVGKGLRAAINDFAVIAELVGAEMLTLASGFAEGAGKVADAVGKGADGLSKLATYVAAPASAIYAFGKSLRLAVQDFAAIADLLATSVVGSAAAFADGAGKVADVVGKGAEALTKLNEYVAPPAAAVYAFGKTIMLVVSDFAAMTGVLGAQTVADATLFADSAGKVVAIIGNAVDGLTKLGTYKAIGNGIIGPFVETVRVLVAGIAQASAGFTADTLTQAGNFADTAGKAVGILANGLTGFAHLNEFGGVAASSLAAFVATTTDLVQRMVGAAAQFSSDGLKAASEFADAAGKSLGLLSNGVTGFKSLGDLITPSQASIERFAQSAATVVTAIQRVAANLNADGLKSAGDFADAAGKVLGIVASGVTGLKDLITFTAPAQSAMDAFANAVRDMMATLATLAGTMATEGADAAATFATAVGKVFSGLNSATSFFKSLDGMLLPDQAGIDRILAPMLSVVRTLADASRTLDAATITGAGSIADLIGRAASGIQAGNQALAGAGAGGQGGSGNTYQIIFSGPVYGSADFDQRILQAKSTLERQGAW